jgi:hypothetical protein
MSGSFTSDDNLFQQSQQHPHSPSDQTLSMGTMSLPQYFPVYDYGPSGDSHTYPLLQMDTAMAGQMVSPIHSRQSLSPDTNMQTTWNDFVMGLGMAN